MKSSEKCHYDNGPAEYAVSVNSNANELTNEILTAVTVTMAVTVTIKDHFYFVDL